jgi:hypothetical protein
MEEYRYECGSVAGFIQRVVVLSQRGYRYFVEGEIREGRAPEEVDAKLLAKYDLRLTRRQRAYRKAQGLSNGHYVRFDRNWVLLATSPRFFLEVDRNERPRDLRESPIRAHGYSVSLRRDGSARTRGEVRRRASVRLDEATTAELRAYFEELSIHRSRERLAAEFWRISSEWEAYAPVHRQFRAMLWRANERRREAGFDRVPLSCIRIHRRLPKHFPSAVEGLLREAARFVSEAPNGPEARVHDPLDLGLKPKRSDECKGSDRDAWKHLCEPARRAKKRVPLREEVVHDRDARGC